MTPRRAGGRELTAYSSEVTKAVDCDAGAIESMTSQVTPHLCNMFNDWEQ